MMGGLQMMIRRLLFTPSPPPGDYILTRTGVSWNLDRTTDRGSVLRVSAGETARETALASIRVRAENDKVDAWEMQAPGSYRLIKACRSPA